MNRADIGGRKIFDGQLLDQYADSQGLRIVREFVDAETAKRPGNGGGKLLN